MLLLQKWRRARCRAAFDISACCSGLENFRSLVRPWFERLAAPPGIPPTPSRITSGTPPTREQIAGTPDAIPSSAAKSERFNFAGKQEDVAAAKQVLHLILFAQEDHVRAELLFARHPLGHGSLRPVSDHQELGGDLLANAGKDLNDIGHAFDGPKIGEVNQYLLPVRREFVAAALAIRRGEIRRSSQNWE